MRGGGLQPPLILAGEAEVEMRGREFGLSDRRFGKPVDRVVPVQQMLKVRSDGDEDLGEVPRVGGTARGCCLDGRDGLFPPALVKPGPDETVMRLQNAPVPLQRLSERV